MPLHTTDDGCRLAYELSGPDEAPVVVLSNSLGTDHHLWDAQIGVLEPHYRVMRYDTRGHGASGVPPGEYAIARLGQDVLSLMDHAGVRRAHVCGISIGGLTALWLGVHEPDRVDRLVLATTAARIGSEASWTDRMRLVEADGLAALAEVTMTALVHGAIQGVQPRDGGQDTGDAAGDVPRGLPGMPDQRIVAPCRHGGASLAGPDATPIWRAPRSRRGHPHQIRHTSSGLR